MKKVYCIAIILFAFKIVIAQDFIVLKTGEEIKSKVTEITSNEIKSIAFNNNGRLCAIAGKDRNIY